VAKRGRRGPENEIQSIAQVLQPVRGFGDRVLREALRGLSLVAGRILHETSPADLRRVLAPAEAVAHRLQLRGKQFPLLQAPLELELDRMVHAARSGQPADDAEVSGSRPAFMLTGRKTRSAMSAGWDAWRDSVRRSSQHETSSPTGHRLPCLMLAGGPRSPRSPSEAPESIGGSPSRWRRSPDAVSRTARRDEPHLAKSLARRWSQEAHEKDLARPFALIGSQAPSPRAASQERRKGLPRRT